MFHEKLTMVPSSVQISIKQTCSNNGTSNMKNLYKATKGHVFFMLYIKRDIYVYKALGPKGKGGELCETTKTFI